MNTFIKSIYVEKKYTTKQKTEEFQEIKRKASIVRKGSVKEETKNLELDLDETRTSKEIVNNINPSTKIVTENKVQQKVETKKDDLFNFLSEGTPKNTTQNTQPQKKTLTLDDLFGSPSTQPPDQNYQNNQMGWNQGNTQFQNNQQGWNTNNQQGNTFQNNQQWNTKPPTNNMNGFWDTQPVQNNQWDSLSTQKQPVQNNFSNNNTWNQPVQTKTNPPVTKSESTNPFDTFDFSTSKKSMSTNPFDTLDSSFSNMSLKTNNIQQPVNNIPQQKPITPIAPKTQTTIEAPKNNNNMFDTPKTTPIQQTVNVPQQKPMIPKLPINGEEKKEVTNYQPKIDPTPVKKVDPVPPKNTFEEPKKTNINLTDNKKGNTESLGTLEKISKEDSNNFAWENHFFTDSKSIDQLRGEARKDEFESQFKDITPQKINPFSSKTKWEK